MDAIITFFENFAQPFKDAWYGGGWAALLATVIASPVIMIFIRLLFAYLSGKSASKKARRRKALAEKEKERIELENLIAIAKGGSREDT